MTDGYARRTLGVAGELLVTAGVVVLLFVAYLLWWTGVETARAQDRLQSQLAHPLPADPGAATRSGTSPPRPVTAGPPPALGQAWLRIRIPRLGADWSWVVVEGVGLDQLADGPGHYPGTARPGQVGNVAIAGHRATHGEPFADLDAVRVRDAIVLGQGAHRWTYRVSRTFLTTPTDLAVILPVPGHPGGRPTQARITLTTCDPRFGSQRRLIVDGVLASAT